MLIAVALALLDFAPVFFLSLGLFFLVQLVDRLEPRCRRMALAGFMLIVVGALARAVSNLDLAVSGQTIPVFSTSLFVFSGPGFTLMGAALIRSRARTLGRFVTRDPWIIPTLLSWAVLILAFYLKNAVGGETWKTALFGLALAGLASTCFAAASLGLMRQLHMAALLLVLNLAGVSAVIALRTFIPENPWLHLLGEIVHTAAEAGLAFAAWRVAAEYHARVGPTAKA